MGNGTSVDVSELLDIEEIRVAAEKVMPGLYKDFVNNIGVDDTLRGDLAAWNELALRPRALVDVSNVDTSVTLLGTQISSPIIAAPFIGSSLLNPEAEVAIARAAVNSDTIMTLSMNGHRGPEPIGEVAAGRYWQQLYWVNDQYIVEDVVARAVSSGATALCLTVDLPVMPAYPREMRNTFYSLFEYWDKKSTSFTCTTTTAIDQPDQILWART